MAFRKNKKFIDPRYFVDEKMETIKEEDENTIKEWEGESAATNRMMKQAQRKKFTGGSIDIEPLSGEEQTAGTEAYYELFEFLADSNLPGNKPSEKLQYALRWIAKFEQGGAAGEVGYPQAAEPEPEEVVDAAGRPVGAAVDRGYTRHPNQGDTRWY